MVKRKASDSVDDWLREGKLAAAARHISIEAIPEAVTPLPLPTVEPQYVQVAEGDVAAAVAEVEVTNAEAANWFWGLFVQAGYELFWLATGIAGKVTGLVGQPITSEGRMVQWAVRKG